jgi:hypothetical protein
VPWPGACAAEVWDWETYQTVFVIQFKNGVTFKCESGAYAVLWNLMNEASVYAEGVRRLTGEYP